VTLLTIVQDVADLVGLPRPVGVFSSTDTQVRQLLALANMEGRMLSRKGWTLLEREALHTTIAAEDQGAMNTIMPGQRYPTNQTQWNRSQQEPLGGPLSAQEWQALQAFTVTGPYQDFRIRQGNLFLIPAPAAGESLAFEYMSSYWCQSEAGADQSAWAADGDVGVLDEELMTMGTRWRFLRAKGMDYAEEFTDYEMSVSDAMARDGNARIMHLDRDDVEPHPSIRAPIGSWNI
jgi:hypothetical protein